MTDLRKCLFTLVIVSVFAGCSTAPAGRIVASIDDAGFESGQLAAAPIQGWYSDDAQAGRIHCAADSAVHVEGASALRVEVVEPRAAGRGTAFVCQAVATDGSPAWDDAAFRLALRGAAVRTVTIEVYVWDEENRARTIGAQEVALEDGEWKRVSVPFQVPAGHRQVGFWIYIPAAKGGQLWLDDAAVTARA